MTLRQRLVPILDRVVAVLLVAIVFGTVVAFGGSVWWARPAIAMSTAWLVFASLARAALDGSCRLLKSPLMALGVLALGLAAFQLLPMPSRLVIRLSPLAGTIRGPLVASVKEGPEADSATVDVTESRIPLTTDRAATLRWLMGAIACLSLFCVAAHFADRLGRLLLIWGSVIAAFGLCTGFGVVQLIGQQGSLYGFLQPGKAPPWAPSMAEELTTPNATVLRLAGDPLRPGAQMALVRPDRPFAIGPLLGGPGAYLALAALALPLLLGSTLQTLAPRGSREPLTDRLRHHGGWGRITLLTALLVTGAGLSGYLAGLLLSLPLAAGLILAGIPASRGTGLRWMAPGLTLLALIAIGVGVAMGDALGRPAGSSPLAFRESWGSVEQVWRDALRIARDVPIVGCGLGSFASVYPLYKSQDLSQTTALSSFLQWWVEAGAIGLILLGLGALWCLWRLPGALRRVGTADRALAFGLVGALTGFALFSAVHWTVELTAIAVAAAAVGGTCNRWLAGGTDLFVEYG